MGCGGSKTQKTTAPAGASVSSAGPLSEDEILKRIVMSNATSTKKFAGGIMEKDSYTMRYAFVSQKGYYPNGKY